MDKESRKQQSENAENASSSSNVYLNFLARIDNCDDEKITQYKNQLSASEQKNFEEMPIDRQMLLTIIGDLSPREIADLQASLASYPPAIHDLNGLITIHFTLERICADTASALEENLAPPSSGSAQI